MRVFTQRVQLALLPPWEKPKRGEVDWHDEFLDTFAAKHPNMLQYDDHPLDYCIVLSPILYLLGYYWGDESRLAAATDFIDSKMKLANYNAGAYETWVVTCDDNQHPTNLPLADLFTDRTPPVGHTITGYYLRSDPDTFISIP